MKSLELWHCNYCEYEGTGADVTNHLLNVHGDEQDALLRTMSDKRNMATSDDLSISPDVTRALREVQEAS
jgi:hypothetical protein